MRPRALIILAGGFEETEAIVPADLLARCEVDVTLAGLGSAEVEGAHGIRILADRVLGEEPELPDAVILPGGLPGAEHLAASSAVNQIVRRMAVSNGLIGAICASPALVLAPTGVLKGRKATCYPGLEKNFSTDIEYVKDDVVRDGNIITGRGPGTVFAFAAKIAEGLVGTEKALAVSEMMLVS